MVPDIWSFIFGITIGYLVVRKTMTVNVVVHDAKVIDVPKLK
jgi:hypothetical protein